MNRSQEVDPVITREQTPEQSAWQTWDHPDSNWNKAVLQNPQVDPYCCRTEWQLSFHEAMEPGRKLIVREAPGSVLAMAEYNWPDHGRVYGPLESHWFFGCPLIGPDAIELLDELSSELSASAGMPPPSFIISGLAPDSPLLKQLALKLRSRFDFLKGRSEILCSASLEGGIDGYLARRSAKHRRSVSKQYRKATREGVTFERHAPTTPEQTAQVYARMIAVEEASWKGIGECGMATETSSLYYDCMIQRLARYGGARVMFARHGEKDIGFIFGGLVDTVYRGQQFSYAEDWKSYSIGNLLQLEQIKWLCDDNVERYDMGPMMEYKDHWTEIRRTITAVMLRQKRPRSIQTDQ
jgi:hypothetical protein